jgi:putative spermidine/putrescine transport system ATP-binding protein
MLGLSVGDLTKRFATFTALDHVSLDIGLGEFVCFLGPSGCGKTTLLRIIAGLETPTTGRVSLNGKDITDIPANRRGFGMVFQSLALFPHLSVAENIAYSLRLKNRSRPERKARVAELLELVRLPGLGHRGIAQLSGGQRQRVAIARALAQEPSLLLLDEPLSALDAKLREEMQIELKLLQQQLKLTTILVTHDQREAMTMGDSIVVMAGGRVQQTGSPIEIYRRPSNRFVASFIGQTNLIDATIEDKGHVRVGDHVTRVGTLETATDPGRAITLSVRPEDVRLTRMNGSVGLSGEIAFVRDIGASIEAHVVCGEHRIVSVTTPRDWIGAAPGDAVMIEFPPEACRVLGE